MIKKSLKILKVLVAGFMSLVSLFILYQLIMYLTTPVYSFSHRNPSGGEVVQSLCRDGQHPLEKG